MSYEEASAICRSALAILSEHFDAVQILACKLEQDGATTTIKRGSGLWHARAGMAHAFLEQARADQQAWAVVCELKEQKEEEEDE
jgi:invasion protein IalB